MELRLLRKRLGPIHHDTLQFRQRELYVEPTLAGGRRGYSWSKWQDVPIVEEAEE